MHERDPRRLKHTEGTPDALAQALQALRNGPDDSARLARVSKRLAPMLDAPPPRSTAPAPAPALEPASPPVLTKPSIMKFLVAGLAVVAPLLWLARMQWQEPTPPSAAQPSAIQAPAQPAQPSAAMPTAAQPTESHTPAADSGSPSTRARAPLALAKAARKRGETSTRNAPAAQTRSAANATATANQSAPAPEQPTATAHSEHSQAAHPPAKPEAQKRSNENEKEATEPKPAVAGGSLPRTASESELLFNARKALPDDAELALRLLTEHAARFPKGQLVPEREVLAIETLRRLGRTQEAEVRLQSFQTRYPNSLHLQRLQH